MSGARALTQDSLEISDPLQGSKPNILIFMPDQLRYDALGCCGNEMARTPSIDRFANRGTRFRNCFTQASVCSQSRCSIFTGTYPHVSGHRSLENLIKPWEPNILRSLKEDGYHVACLAPRGDTFAPSVTEMSVTEYGFFETPDFVPRFAAGEKRASNDIWGRLFYKGVRNSSDALDYDEAVVRSALSWLDCPPEEPWVLFMPLLFPHCPFYVEEPYFSMHSRERMPKRAQAQEKTGYEPAYMRCIRERYGTARATDETWDEVAATYYGMVTRLDDQFGRILDKIDGTNLCKNTISFFFTDHGEYLGDYGLIEKWPSGLSDSLVHEPLIIGGAGIPEGRVIDAMTEMVDLVPTLSDICGVKELFPHNGSSWMPLLTGQVTQHKGYAFSEGGFLESEEPLLEQAPYPYDIKAALQHEDTSLVGKAISCRDSSWTYIYRLYEPAELYNRLSDPMELHNLAAAPQWTPIARKMENEILRWLVETSDLLPFRKDPRAPEVNLKSPRDQLNERLATRNRNVESKDASVEKCGA
jgi:arylsulfatase A-like enzyme